MYKRNFKQKIGYLYSYLTAGGIPTGKVRLISSVSANPCETKNYIQTTNVSEILFNLFIFKYNL